jgi:hypothetical protein
MRLESAKSHQGAACAAITPIEAECMHVSDFCGAGKEGSLATSGGSMYNVLYWRYG